MPQNYNDGEDEFAVPGTAEQSADETQSNGESEANIAAPSEVDQNEQPRPVEPTQTVTRAGKPSSRYDYVKL